MIRMTLWTYTTLTDMALDSFECLTIDVA